jgi:small subunit ribosomal protein S20
LEIRASQVILDEATIMPVTKTAKRALRSSKNKEVVNNKIISRLEIAIRTAKKSTKKKDIAVAISLSDRAAKKKIIHKNKASRLKSQLSKLVSKSKSSK